MHYDVTVLAHLILAHREPTHLVQLVDALTDGTDDIVLVHVDARVDVRAFKTVLQMDRVVPVQNPVEVRWGGWSIVEATLRTLDEALRQAPDATHYQLMSGDAFPIRDPAETSKIISAATDNFLNCLPLPAPQVEKSLKRITHYYVEHDPRTNPFAMGYKVAHHLMPRSIKALGGRRPYCGSQWWTLTKSAATAVSQVSKTETSFVKFMRHTRVPDEHYVQTILGNMQEQHPLKPALFYADFSNPLAPRPATLNASSILRVKAAGLAGRDAYGTHWYTWARKFSQDHPHSISAAIASWT